MHRGPLVEVVLRRAVPHAGLRNHFDGVPQFVRDEPHQLQLAPAAVDDDTQVSIRARRGDAHEAGPDAVAALSSLDVHVAVARVDDGDHLPKRDGTIECGLHDCGDFRVCRSDV